MKNLKNRRELDGFRNLIDFGEFFAGRSFLRIRKIK